MIAMTPLPNVRGVVHGEKVVAFAVLKREAGWIYDGFTHLLVMEQTGGRLVWVDKDDFIAEKITEG